MSYILNFKHWVKVNESNKTQGIFEQVALTAIALDKHPDCIAMGKAVAAAGGGNTPYDQVIEYAGKQLYCLLPAQSNNTSGNTADKAETLSFKVYAIGKSKFNIPIPVYLGSCYVNKLGKVSPVMDASGKGVSISDNSLSMPGDTTGTGFKDFNSSFWDPYATPKFLQYVNNICANTTYLKSTYGLIRRNAADYKNAVKPTKGMASLMQKVMDAAIAAV